MALSRIKNWIAEVLTASDLNAEFTNILNYFNNGTFIQSFASFSAYLSGATANNITGDGTAYAVVCDTEDRDTLSNFAAGIFTAPVTGNYFFVWQVTTVNVGAGHTSANPTLVTSDGRTFAGPLLSAAAIKEGTSGSSFAGITMTALISLTAGQTVTPKITVSGSTKTVGVYGDTGPTHRYTSFSGCQVLG